MRYSCRDDVLFEAVEIACDDDYKAGEGPRPIINDKPRTWIVRANSFLVGYYQTRELAIEAMLRIAEPRDTINIKPAYRYRGAS